MANPIPIIKKAASDILRWDQIVFLKVVESIPIHPPHFPDATVTDVRFSVGPVTKGPLTGPVPSFISIRMTYSPIATATPNGRWSFVHLKPGDLMVVFCDKSDKGLTAQLMAEPPVCRVEASPEAAHDVERAADIESGDVTPDKAIALAKISAASIGHLLIHYLCARFEDAWTSEEKDFELLLGLMEDPRLGNVARVSFIDAIQNMLDRTQTFGKSDPVKSYARSLFRLLGIPEAKDLHENVIGTDLPNLLGIEGGAERQDATAIFAGRDAEKAAAVRALESAENRKDAQHLLNWINHRDN